MSNCEFVCLLAESTTKLPLFSSLVPAGFPSPAQDHLEERLSLDELLNIHAPHVFIARAVGDSMTGAGLFDRDLMVIDRAREPRPGHVVVAMLNGETFVKRLDKQQGQWVLRSENPAYPPRYVLESDELQIWGVVGDSLRHHGFNV
ncbi:S24 family peptidase [Pseudomonas tohonis]|uniref:LexA family protein n=1 Tax=Pseudomonas solani TaxID=2731552 RepID=UPI0003967FC7|nr:DNA polymerase V [Pseudomonas alcaligenes OT 69]MDN4146595.1 S24 family peptidase [Pseudomonas tohonis]